MSLKIKKRNENHYLYFQRKNGETIFLGKIGEISKYPNRVEEALDILLDKDSSYFEYEKKLLSILTPKQREKYLPKLLKKIVDERNDLYSLSDSVFQEEQKRQTDGDRTKLWPVQPPEKIMKEIRKYDRKTKDKLLKKEIKLTFDKDNVETEDQLRELEKEINEPRTKRQLVNDYLIVGETVRTNFEEIEKLARNGEIEKIRVQLAESTDKELKQRYGNFLFGDIEKISTEKSKSRNQH